MDFEIEIEIFFCCVCDTALRLVYTLLTSHREHALQKVFVIHYCLPFLFSIVGDHVLSSTTPSSRRYEESSR